MADETDTTEDIADGEDAAPTKKKMAGKTLVLFVILPALLVVGGGGAAAMMLLGGEKETAVVADDAKAGKDAAPKDEPGKAGGDDPKGGDDKKDDGGKGGDDKGGGGGDKPKAIKQIGSSGDPSFYTLPEMLVNLNSGSGRQAYLKLKLTFETDNPAIFDKLDPILPRVQDQFQMFLRELRIEDLDGTAGQYRLRRELLRRVNLAIAPDYVDAVLIEEMLVQ